MNDTLFKTTLGEVVKAWREQWKWSQTEFASRSGYSKGYISGLEKNKTRQPGEKHLTGLARALDIPVEYLILRRLPNDLSAEEQAELAALRNSTKKRGGFTFGSPIPTPRRGYMDEEEELQQILAQLDELRGRVKKLIARKGRQH